MSVERIQLRRGTAEQWTTTNPILGAAEIGVELVTNKFKIGDGSSTWDELSYFSPGDFANYIPSSQKGTANGVATLDANGAIPTGQLANIINSAPSTLDTLNELAAALGDDPNFATTIIQALSEKSDTDHTHTLEDITDITANAAELNTLDGITATAAELNVLDGIDPLVTVTKINHLKDVTGDIQSQFTGKQDAISGAATTVVSQNLTANSVLISDVNGKIAASDTISTTELGYLNGLTGTDTISERFSNVDTALGGKVDEVDGQVTTASSGSTVVRNITLSTANPTGGSDGQVWLKYIP